MPSTKTPATKAPAAEPNDRLPRAMRELWGVAEAARRGPKPAMTVRQIAAAGVAIADADGLDAVSMAAVAKRLAFTTMSLYRYVDSKSALHAVMTDEAIGPAPKLNRRRGWRGQLEEWAKGDAVQLAAHPWVLDVRLGTPPVGPHLIAWMDVGFQVLLDARLTEEQAASSLLIVDGYVRNHVLLGLQYAGSETTTEWTTQLRSVLDPERLPAVSAVMEAGGFDSDQDGEFPGDEFDFGLGLLLDGIEKLIRRS